MPLTGNKSDNIAELIRKYKRTGKIGGAKPKSMKQALAIANAVVHDRNKGKKGRQHKQHMRAGGMVAALEASK